MPFVRPPPGLVFDWRMGKWAKTRPTNFVLESWNRSEASCEVGGGAERVSYDSGLAGLAGEGEARCPLLANNRLSGRLVDLVEGGTGLGRWRRRLELAKSRQEPALILGSRLVSREPRKLNASRPSHSQARHNPSTADRCHKGRQPDDELRARCGRWH